MWKELKFWNLKPSETYIMTRGSPDYVYGQSSCEQCLLCVTYKTSSSSTLDMQVGLLQRGPLSVPPTCEQTLSVAADV